MPDFDAQEGLAKSLYIFPWKKNPTPAKRHKFICFVSSLSIHTPVVHVIFVGIPTFQNGSYVS